MARTKQDECLGRQGEDFAADYYRERGAQILARNERVGRDELDLIVREPDETVVFVEVKTRFDGSFGGAEAVTSAKLDRIRRAAARWLDARREPRVRVDVLEVFVARAAKDGDGDSSYEFEAVCFEGVDDGARG